MQPAPMPHTAANNTHENTHPQPPNHRKTSTRTRKWNRQIQQFEKVFRSTSRCLEVGVEDQGGGGDCLRHLWSMWSEEALPIDGGWRLREINGLKRTPKGHLNMYPTPPPPCSGQTFSTVRATVRGGPFLVKKKPLSRALRSDPKPQNMFRIYTTN